MFTMTDFGTSDLPLRPQTRRAGLREMEGRVDENNRSLPSNPFVSTVLIHLSVPSTPSPPSSLILSQSLLLHCAIHPSNTLPTHKQHKPAGTHARPLRQDNQQQYSSTMTTNIQLRLNSVLDFTLLLLSFFFFWKASTSPSCISLCLCVSVFSIFLCVLKAFLCHFFGLLHMQ